MPIATFISSPRGRREYFSLTCPLIGLTEQSIPETPQGKDRLINTCRLVITQPSLHTRPPSLRLEPIRYHGAHGDSTDGAPRHRGLRPRGRDRVLRSTWTRTAGTAVGRGPLGGSRRGARRRPGRYRDAGDAGRPRTTRADEIPHAVASGRRQVRAVVAPSGPRR